MGSLGVCKSANQRSPGPPGCTVPGIVVAIYCAGRNDHTVSSDAAPGATRGFSAYDVAGSIWVGVCGV